MKTSLPSYLEKQAYLYRLDKARKKSAALPSLSDEEFAHLYLWILDKEKQKRRLTYNRVQSHLMSNLTGRDIVVKYRQGGISTAIQGRQFRRAITETVALATLAHDDDTTQRLRRMATFFLENLPENIRPARSLDNAALTIYPATDSEVLIKKAGSTSGGRGFTLSEAHLSEAAFYPDLESILSGLAQAGNPRLILETTANGAQGYFYNLVMAALKGENDWKVHFYPWWWQDEYHLPLEPGEELQYTDEEAALAATHHLTPEQIKWRRMKMRELPRTFLQEYPEDIQTCFLLSGFGYFGNITGSFVIKPGSRKRIDGHRYVAGLDFGQQTDFTALVIIDVDEREVVYVLRVNRLSWEEMRRRVREACKIWRPHLLYGEKNAMGSTNLEALRNEFAGDGLGDVGIRGFDMTAVSKPPLMASLYSAIHEIGLGLYDDPIYRDEFNSAIAKQTHRGWTVESPRDRNKSGDYDENTGHGDTVVATALAWKGAQRV